MLSFYKGGIGVVRWRQTAGLIILCLLLLGKGDVFAQETTMEAKVVWIVEQGLLQFGEKQQPFQTLAVEITSGVDKGARATVDYAKAPQASNVSLYRVGDRVVLGKSVVDGEAHYYIVDRVRRTGLYGLFGVFVMVALVVAKRQAIRSLLALAVSFAVIFYMVLPQLLAGTSPILVSILTAFLMIPLTFYVSHGFGPKTHVAVGATFVTLILTTLLSALFVSWTHLSGYASEEASFLQYEHSFINVQGLLLAGIIIGVLGILDDITISQAAVVDELLTANPNLPFRRLYSQAMRVGRDHVASMINTLVMVYVGAAMPLLLLFINNPKPFNELINYEIVAEEIVRTLTGSVGLILAVPITTLLAAWRFKQLQLKR